MTKIDTIDYLKKRISTSENAAKIMQSFIGNNNRESLILICLNSKNGPTHIQTITVGSINQLFIQERFKTAILNNANSIVLEHNHPSGDVTPSPEDISITKRLMLISDMMVILFYDQVFF